MSKIESTDPYLDRKKIQTKKYYFFMDKFDFQNLGSDLFGHLRFLQWGFHYRTISSYNGNPIVKI